MIRFEKKKQSVHCKVMVEKKQHWNLKYQIQDPIILHTYDLNIVNAETGWNFEINDQLWQHSRVTFDQD